MEVLTSFYFLINIHSFLHNYVAYIDIIYINVGYDLYYRVRYCC